MSEVRRRPEGATGLEVALAAVRDLARRLDRFERQVKGSYATRKAMDNATKVVQIVTAVSTLDDSTTSTTFVSTSLQASITPLYADSLLVVSTTGRGTSRHDGSGTASARRDSFYRIRNITDGVNIEGAGNIMFGRALVAGSTAVADSKYPVALMGRYQVNSTAQRTFELQYSSGAVVETLIQGTVTPTLMTIMEVRP